MLNCIFGCVCKPGTILHRFPNPKLDKERLQKWRNIIGELGKGLDDQDLYVRNRICHKHFEAKYWNRNNRINRLGIPTLFLPDSSRIFKKPSQTAESIEVKLSSKDSCTSPGKDEVYNGNTIDNNNVFEENLPETDEANNQIFSPHMDSLRKNSVAVKYASVQMSAMDIHICGECHSVFHFIHQFKEHKKGITCSGVSPYRDAKESISNTWAFLLWKSSTLVAHVGEDGNSQLMKKWNELPEKTRDAWFIAGRQVFELTKIASIDLESTADRSKQIDVENNMENDTEDPLLQELKVDHDDNVSSNGPVESEQDPLSLEPDSKVPKWYIVPEAHSSNPLETRKNSICQRQLQNMKPCMVVLQDISKQLQGSKMPLKVKPLGQLMAKKKKPQRTRRSTIQRRAINTLRKSKLLPKRASRSQNTTLKYQKTSLRARAVTLQPSTALVTKNRSAAIHSKERILEICHPRLKSSKTSKKQVQSSTVDDFNNIRLHPRLVNQQNSSESCSGDSLLTPGTESRSERTGMEKSQVPTLKLKKSQLEKSALKTLTNRPWRANFKIKEDKPMHLWKLPSGFIMKEANPLMKKVKLMVNNGTQIDETKYKKVYYIMKKDNLEESQQLTKASLFVQKYNELWKKNKLPATLKAETTPENTQIQPVSSQANTVDNNQVNILRSIDSTRSPEIIQECPLPIQEKNQTEITTDETQTPMHITNNATSTEEPSSSDEPMLSNELSKQNEHAYSKYPPSAGPIVRKPVIRTRIFPTPPVVNNGIIITSWGVNNRYLEQTTIETPISSSLLTTDAMKERSKKLISTEKEDQFFRNLGPLPPPSPEPDLTLCPLTGELLAPTKEADGQVEVEETVNGSALDEEQENMSLPSMPMLLVEDMSFHE